MGWTVYDSSGNLLSSIALVDNVVATAKIADDAVTYAKMQNLATADRVLGSISTGVIGEVQIVPDMLATDAVTNVKVATGIDAVKLADGSVTNAEFQYINTLSSNAQTQIGLKAAIANPTFTTAATSPSFITGNSGTIKLMDGNGSNFATIAAHATTTADVAYTWPAAGPGTNGYALTSTTGGVMSWAEAGGASLSGSTNNTIVTVTSANAMQGEATLTFDGAKLFVNGGANASMSAGLTIQQNQYDNEALCVKSTDIAHGISGTETDSYFTVQKANPTVGGAMISGYAETGDYAGIQLRTFVIDANGTKTASGVGSLNVTGYHGTDGGPLNDSANGNMVVFRAGNTHTRFIFDVEGDLYYDGSSNSYDGYADAELTRALSYTMQAATSKPSTIIHNKWDNFVEYNEQDLIDAGILGGPVVGVDDSERGLVNLTQLQRLHNGAIWQLHSRLSDQAEEITALKGQLTALVGEVKE